MDPGSGGCTESGFEGEGEYRVEGRVAGRWFCRLDADGRPVLWALDTRADIGSESGAYDGANGRSGNCSSCGSAASGSSHDAGRPAQAASPPVGLPAEPAVGKLTTTLKLPHDLPMRLKLPERRRRRTLVAKEQ